MKPLRAMGAACLALCLSATASADYARKPALEMRAAHNMPLLDLARAGERLVAVGEQGVIITSADNGNSWQQAPVPVSEALTSVTFVDEQHGWAAGHGGVILHSSDGGQSWQLQFDGDRANQQWLDFARTRVEALENFNPPEGESISEQVLVDQLEEARYAVEDAELAVETGPADPFLDIWFSDSNTGIAVGAYGMLYRTEDGGRNWELAVASIHNPDRYHLYSLSGTASGHVLLSGEGGLLFRSNDAGHSWQTLNSGYDGSLFGVLATPERLLSFGLRGTILSSDDGGDSWQTVGDAAGFSLYGGSVLSGGNIALVGAGGGILLSEDGGRSFAGTVHESRGTFSAVTDLNGKLLLVGMPGFKTHNKANIAP